MEYLENEGNKIIQTVTGVDHGIAEGMDLTHALDHTIALIWPMRKRRIMHDMVELHFNKMVSFLLVAIQVILLLQTLDNVGRNWDHISSIDRAFLPAYVALGASTFIYLCSFVYACFAFVAEGGDPRLLEFDELNRFVRLFYHFVPVCIHTLDILFCYAIIHCRLNNAHQGEGFCNTFNLDTIVVAFSLIVSTKIFHFLLGLYNLAKHTQQPAHRRQFRRFHTNLTTPLLHRPTSAFVAPTKPNRQPIGTPRASSSNANAIPMLPNTPRLDDSRYTDFGLEN